MMKTKDNQAPRKSYLNRLFKFYRNIPIKRKLLLVLYIQIFIPLILVAFFSFKNSEDIISKKSLAYSNDIISLIELRLQDTLRNMNKVTQELATDSRIYSALLSDDNESKLNNYEMTSQLKNVFLNIVLTRPEVESICIVTNKRKFYTYDSNSTDTNIKSTVMQNYTKIINTAKSSNNKLAWFLDSKNSVVQGAYVVKLIYDKDDFTEIGMMVVQINKSFLETVLQGLETEVMQNTAVLSEDDEIIISKDATNANGYEKVISSIAESKNTLAEKKIKFYEDPNKKLFIAYTALTEPNWRIVTYIPLKQLYSDVNSLRDRILILCICMMLFLGVTSILVSIDFLKPIKKLVKAMERMSIDNIKNSYIEVDRTDELGFLHKTFNNMAKEIDHLVNWIYREQLTRKEAEIKALQSQINPHFLFNTLESINWMARLNNVPEISETVSDLSSLLEASIGRDDKLITMEEEFIYIDKYINLLKRRFDDRITLIKEIDPTVLYLTIPRLLIQPLIENAVQHGIENNRSNGIITLTAKMYEDNITIEVIDNGSGISNEDLIRLNKGLEMDNATYFKTFGSKKSKSIGIENVNRRIKLFYGENYGVKIESKQHIYTKVSVILPVQNYNNTKEGYYVQGSNS